ncbi:MAG: hypothetical protein HQM14_05900 [SAR324 cluster bacterium]|nr:hypothetical protein [SAR324 cluster bacterium]
MRKHIYFGLGILLVLLFSYQPAYAEYRAYELEIFDRVEQRREIVITTFSPSDYTLIHGGAQRIGVIIRASWMCWGNTSKFKKVCPPPAPISPRFQVGDSVQVVLKKHISDQWVGKVENIFYRPDLRSNVYGVRFPEKKDLYTRYYEANLQAAP